MPTRFVHNDVCVYMYMFVCVSSEDQMLPVLFVWPCVYIDIKMTISAETEAVFGGGEKIETQK